MQLEQFLDLLEQSPESVDFKGVIALIDSLYEFSPAAFRNGSQQNAAGENSGSCKLLAFAQRQGLSEQQTLHCFGEFYRTDVLQHPDGEDHQNIRNFMHTGWAGVVFEADPLNPR